MKKCRKVLSLFIALTLILSSLPITLGSSAFTASAAEVRATDASLVLKRPVASVYVTDITRVAYAVNSMKQPSGSNSVIVKATPSGMPELNGTFSSAIAYAGETPVATQIAFTPGVELDSEPTISCSNTTVTLSNYSYSNGTYVWSVTGGTATVGTTLIFTITYKHTDSNAVTGKSYTRTYNSYGVSYVEAIATPAGEYSTKRTYEDFWLGQSTKNRSYVASYVLGANTYGTLYNNGAGEGSVYFESTGSSPGWTTEYGMMHRSDGQSASRDYNIAYHADDNRPISYVYFDRSFHSTLSDLNLRLITTNLDQASNSNERVTVSIRNTYVSYNVCNTYSDEDDDSSLTNNTFAADEIGLTGYSGSIFGPGANFMQYFTGSGPSEAVGTYDYTFTNKYQTAADWSEVFIGHSHSLRIITTDKGALRTFIDQIHGTDPTVMTTDVPSGDFKGYNPQEWYYSSGWEAFLNAYKSALSCLKKPNATQDEINTVYNAVVAAYNDLEMRTADYSVASAYYNQAVAKDSSLYTLASWAKVQNILDSYVNNYSAIYQPAVDKMGADLVTALNSLEEATADYTEFNAHLKTINTIMSRSLANYGIPASEAYNNWSALVQTLTKVGCIYDELDGYIVAEPLLKSEQATVNGYVLQLERGINQLSLKSANYTEASKAKTAYKAVNLSYLVEDCATELTAAYNALVALDGKDLSAQGKIDEATALLNEKLANLHYKPADTSAAIQLLAVANNIDRTQYDDMSAVDTAVADLESKLDLDIRYQNDINRAVTALQSAIDGLNKNLADYSSVNEAIDLVQQRESLIKDTYADSYGFTVETFYSNWSSVIQAIENVEWGLDFSQQAKVNAYADAIINALENLKENTADYTEARVAYDKAYNIVTTGETLYTEESLNRLTQAYTSVVFNKPISEQAIVDGYTITINDAIERLEYLPADYTQVNKQIALANEKINLNLEFEAAHPDHSYYTEDTISALEEAVASVVEGLDITEQTVVDGYAESIAQAISNLVVGPADYTQVDLALLNVPSDLSLYTTLSVATLNATINNINRTYTADKQATVDRYVTSINNAITGLKYKGADYSSVTAALNKVPADSSVYTEDSWNHLQTQINAVVYNLDITHQEEVDNYALAIEQAVEFLRFKTADYTAVDNAIEAANAEIEKGIYTEDSIAVVQAAINAVERDYPIGRQSEVDAFAAAINSAVGKLVQLDADYTVVDEAITAANEEIAKGYYTDASVAEVNKAINAVVRGYKVTRQEEVNAFAAAIVEATSKLEIIYADYTDVDDAIEYARLEIETGYYTDESVAGVLAAIEAVERDYPYTRQEEVDEFAYAIDDAVSLLKYKAADYDAVDEAIERANTEIAKGIYTDESVANLKKEINKVVRGYNILKQAVVDGYATAINTAIGKLETKGADYTSVENAITAANEKIATGYYTDDSVALLQEAINAVEYGLPLDKQSDVEAFAEAIVEATGKLVLKAADYTMVNLAVEYAEGEIAKGIYTDESVAMLREFLASIDYTITADRQDEVSAIEVSVYLAVNELLIPKKPDYTKLAEAIAAARAEIEKGIYTDESVEELNVEINTALDMATDDSITIEHQNIVDEMTATIIEKTISLDPKPADYTSVVNAIAAANEKIATGYYTDDSVALLQEAINAVEYGLDITEQERVVLFANNIVNLTNELTLKSADYTELQKILDLLDNSASEIYTIEYENFNEVMSLIADYRENTVSQNMGLTIDKQAQVNEMTAALQGYIDSLVPAAVAKFEPKGTAVFKTQGGVNYIYGLQTSLTKAKFQSTYVEYENVVLEYDMTTARYLGTGSTVTVKSKSGEVIAVYVIVIYGDVDGSATINARDAIEISNSIAGISESLSGARKLAANVEGSRTTINAKDADVIDAVVAGSMTVNQVTGKGTES